MPRRRRPAVTPRQAEALGRWFLALPPSGKAAVAALALAGALFYLALQNRPPAPPAGGELGAPLPDGARPVLFTWWNVENLFDDRNDKRRSVDEEYDNPFAENAPLRQLKYDRIASALLRLNGGVGPDILACCEVESVRAAELLRDALNAKLPDPTRHYAHLAMINLDGGRHIAPCVISRVPIDPRGTRLHGTQLRILEVRLQQDGHELGVLATHWTSQVTQRGDTADPRTGRGRYATLAADAYRAATARDPAADYLVCGDFNDTPDSTAVRDILGAGPPGGAGLLNLLAGKPADQFGTLYYGRPLIYDQICVSPGLLDDKGWGCRPETVAVTTQGLLRPGATRRQPWRFGNPEPAMPDGERGFSDHFPVSVLLTVRPPGGVGAP